MRSGVIYIIPFYYAAFVFVTPPPRGQPFHQSVVYHTTAFKSSTTAIAPTGTHIESGRCNRLRQPATRNIKHPSVRAPAAF